MPGSLAVCCVVVGVAGRSAKAWSWAMRETIAPTGSARAPVGAVICSHLAGAEQGVGTPSEAMVALAFAVSKTASSPSTLPLALRTLRLTRHHPRGCAATR